MLINGPEQGLQYSRVAGLRLDYEEIELLALIHEPTTGDDLSVSTGDVTFQMLDGYLQTPESSHDVSRRVSKVLVESMGNYMVSGESASLQQRLVAAINATEGSSLRVDGIIKRYVKAGMTNAEIAHSTLEGIRRAIKNPVVLNGGR